MTLREPSDASHELDRIVASTDSVGVATQAGSVDRANVEPAPRPRSRDRSLDVLRGWAIVLMISSHVGASSRLSMLINAHVWVDAAGPFVILSGVVLGMIVAAGKAATATWGRARQLWVIHVGLMLAVVAIHEGTGKLRTPSVADAGGIAAAAWKILALRLQALDYMNILPLFIVFFLVAPLLLAAMKRGATGLVLAASFLLWLVTQRYPGWMRFTDLSCGDEAFVLPAWQFPFVLGLAFGFERGPWRKSWSRHRAWLVPVLAMVVVAVFVIAQLQRRALAGLGGRLPASLLWVFGKEAWGPGRAAYTLSMLLLGYLALEAFRRARLGSLGLLEYLELMGTRSLYCFLVHLPLALLASAIGLETGPAWQKELSLIGALVGVYLLARYRVLARYIPT